MLSQEEGFSPKSSQDHRGCYGAPLAGASFIRSAEDLLFSERGQEDGQEDGAEDEEERRRFTTHGDTSGSTRHVCNARTLQ